MSISSRDPAAPLRLQENISLGVIYICISATMFAIAGTAAKLALKDISPVLLVFWRNLLSCGLFIAWLYFSSGLNRAELYTSRIHLHIARSVLSLMVLYLYFYAVAHIELAKAVLFLSTSPVFLPILAFTFLKKKSDKAVWFGVLFAFFGVFLIINPQIDYRASFQMSWGVVAGIFSGVFGAAATVAIWKMSSTESPTRQLFYFTIISFVLSIPLAVFGWRLPSVESYIPLIVLAIATTLGQYYLSKGCSVAPTDKINTWNYLSIAVSALAAYIGWHEELKIHTIIGIVVVVIGAHITTIKYSGGSRVKMPGT